MIVRKRNIVILTGLLVLGLTVGVAAVTAQDPDHSGTDVCRVLPTDYSLSDTTVSVNEPITITVTVENTCEREETTDVVPMKDGEHVHSKARTVSVPPTSTKTVTVEVNFSSAGDHTVSIFDLESTPVTVSDESTEDPDGDGIPTDEDECPREAEDDDSVQSEDGCPDDPIWTLDHLTEEQRNNACFQRALRLAQHIAMSEEAADAWQRVNRPGLDIEDELAPGEGPEINFTDLGDYGVYRGDAGGPEGQIFVDNDLLDDCNDGNQEFLRLVVTILHETGHWKDDVKKHGGPGDDNGNDTDGEEGTELEGDIFGREYPADGREADIDRWVDPDTWTDDDADPNESSGSERIGVAPASTADGSPVALTVRPTRETVEPGDPVQVDVTMVNTREHTTLPVLRPVVLENYPFEFEIRDADGNLVAFTGPEFRPNLTADDFIILTPGESATVTVNLARDSTRGTPRYDSVTRPGTYNVTAIYDGPFAIPRTSSNTTTVTVEPSLEGDFDGDGEVSTRELQRAVERWSSGDLSTEALTEVVENWSAS